MHVNLNRVHVATVNTLSLKGHLGANNYVNCYLIEEGSFFQMFNYSACYRVVGCIVLYHPKIDSFIIIIIILLH